MNCFNAVFGLVLALFSAVAFAQAVNVNTATAEELDKGLAGIGRPRRLRSSNTEKPTARSGRWTIWPTCRESREGRWKRSGPW